MERNKLIGDIIWFGSEYELFNTITTSKARKNIASQLGNIAFVENLLNEIELRPKRRKNKDIERIKKLRLGLEEIRIDLDCKGL